MKLISSRCISCLASISLSPSLSLCQVGRMLFLQLLTTLLLSGGALALPSPLDARDGGASGSNSTGAGDAAATILKLPQVTINPAGSAGPVTITGTNMGCKAFLGIPFAEPRESASPRVGCTRDGSVARMFKTPQLTDSHRRAPIRATCTQGVHHQRDCNCAGARMPPSQRHPDWQIWNQRRLPHAQCACPE